jgi:orotidine-5'-phosphate decarboxylase
MEHIADKLVRCIGEKGSCVVVGLDPLYERLPQVLRDGSGGGLEGAAAAVGEFCRRVIDATCDVAVAVKPQSAYFELLGWQGLRVLEEAVAYARGRGLLVIDDCKRGDIGSTSLAYANAHIGPGALGNAAPACDFMTVNPYLGTDTLEPFVQVAAANNTGIFVLVRTSNPGSGLIQGAQAASGLEVTAELAAWIDGVAEAGVGVCGYAATGAVVGATYPAQAAALRVAMPRSFFLVPGYGAQGATAADLRPFFNADGLGALVNASRSIIYAYDKAYGAGCTLEQFEQATRAAAVAMRDDIAAVLG